LINDRAGGGAFPLPQPAALEPEKVAMTEREIGRILAFEEILSLIDKMEDQPLVGWAEEPNDRIVSLISKLIAEAMRGQPPLDI
jgi:hypothetical protein